MPASPEQIAANRKNSKQSTGPITPAGKQQSRRNGLKHGLTGEGIVLLREDEAAVARLAEELEDDLRPSTKLGQLLVGRVAAMAIRLEKFAKRDSAETARRVRESAFEFEDGRVAEVATLFADLSNDPAGSVRKLLRTPEGVDRLIQAWQKVRDRLFVTGKYTWHSGDRAGAIRLTGEQPGQSAAPIHRLSRAAFGDFSTLEAYEGAGLDDAGRKAWAVERMVELVDGQIAALRTHRESFGPDYTAMERAEAADIALFDDSKPAILAHKYEAAAERNLYRAIRELREVEAAGVERIESDATPDIVVTCEELASSSPEPEARDVEALPTPDRPEIEPLEPPTARKSGVPETNVHEWERPAAA